MLMMDNVSMYFNTDLSNIGWRDSGENLQVRWPPVKQLLKKTLGNVWLANPLLPIRTILGEHQLGLSIHTMTTIRHSTFPETCSMAVGKPPSKHLSINQFVDRTTFKTTQKDITAKEIPRFTTSSSQHSDADRSLLRSWSQPQEQSSDHDLVTLFRHNSGASEVNTHTFPDFYGDNSSRQFSTPLASDELFPPGLHQNSEKDIVAGLQAFRNSADEKCPLYLGFNGTRRHIRQDDASLENLGPMSLLANVLCPLSPYLKKPPAPEQNHTPAIALPASLLRTFMSTKLRPLTSFLQGIIDVGIEGVGNTRDVFRQETGEPTASGSSAEHSEHTEHTEHSEHFDLQPSNRPRCNVQNMQEIYAASPSETIDSTSTMTNDEYQSLCESSPLSSSHVGAQCRGGSNTGNASCYQGSSGRQPGMDQNSQHKRKRGQQQCGRDHGRRKVDGSEDEDDDDDDSPDSGNPRSSGSKSRQSRNLACPYHKFDPRMFRGQGNGTSKYQSCTREFVDTADVTQHLKRVHDYDENICVRCFTKLSTEELIDHLRKDQLCDMKPWREIEEEKSLIRGCDRWSRLKKLRKKSPRQSSEERWYQMFKAIFPDAPRPSSPYHDGIPHTEGTDLSVTIPINGACGNLGEFPVNGLHIGAWSPFSNGLGALGSLVNSPSPFAQSYQTSMGQPSLLDSHTGLDSFQQSYPVDVTQTMSRSFPPRQPATPTSLSLPVQANHRAASFSGGLGQYSNGQRLLPLQQQPLHRHQTHIRYPQQQLLPQQSIYIDEPGPRLNPGRPSDSRQQNTGRGTRYVPSFNVPDHSAQHPNDLEDIFDTNPQWNSGHSNTFFQNQDRDDVG